MNIKIVNNIYAEQGGITMQYKNLEGIKIPLSGLVYGTGMAKITGDDPGAAAEVLDMAFEAGFRVFDSANSYGNAEKNFGKWLADRGLREQVVILDKGCNPGQKGSTDIFSAETIREQVKESQRRLQTERLDLYILHRDDETKPVDEIVEVLNELKDQGIITHFGGSNWRLSRIQAANAYAKEHGLTGFTVTSPCYSLAEFTRDPWGGSVCLSGEQAGTYRDWLAENQMPTFIYSSLGRGYLSGKYRTDKDKPIEECISWAPIEEYHCEKNKERLHRAEILAEKKGVTVPQICLAWLFLQPQNLFPIVSPGSEKHMRDNVAAYEVQMTAEEAKWLLTGEE